MKRFILMAALALPMIATAKDTSAAKAEKRVVYDYIKLKLDKGEITIKKAQRLWRKHNN